MLDIDSDGLFSVDDTVLYTISADSRLVTAYDTCRWTADLQRSRYKVEQRREFLQCSGGGGSHHLWCKAP